MHKGSTYAISPRTTSQVACKSPLWEISLVIMPACLYTFGRVYWVLLMGRIHRTPHLAHVVLLSIISSSHSSVRLYCVDHIYSSVSACYKFGHCIQVAQNLVYHVHSIILAFMLVQLCFISALLYPTCSLPFKY